MTQTALTSLLLLAIGYLLGAIPSGYLAGRWLKGIDLRECGSGSTGATNVLRNVGKGPALVVFLIDVGKGALAVLLAKTAIHCAAPDHDTPWIIALCGFARFDLTVYPTASASTQRSWNAAYRPVLSQIARRRRRVAWGGCRP